MVRMHAKLLCSGFLLVLFAVSVEAQGNFVYANNDTLGPNNVSAFSISPNGALSEVVGSPFATGGAGFNNGFLASNRIVVSPTSPLLFVANNLSHDISVFQINSITGALSLVLGSPFPVMGDFIGAGTSLAVTPDGRFLMTADPGSEEVSVFKIAANGALSLVQGSHMSIGVRPVGIKVSPNGKFLVVAVLGFPPGVIVYRIGVDGLLVEVPGSPFATLPDESSTVTVEVNCESSLVFAGQAFSTVTMSGTVINVFRMDANGGLVPVAGSPFTFPADSDTTSILLSPDGRNLFATNTFINSVNVLNVASNGGLTLAPGAPFPVGSFGPTGLGVTQDGTYLYTANTARSISGFRVGSNGNLSTVPGSPFTTGQAGGLKALAIFPGKTCGPAFDICIQDDSSSSTLRINSTTGDYRFANCSGFTLAGLGSLTKRGSIVTLQNYAADRRVLARIDANANKGTASIQLFSQSSTFTITDRNTANNSCACAGN